MKYSFTIMSRHWLSLETQHLLLGQFMASFSDLLKVMSIDITFTESFLIAFSLTVLWLNGKDPRTLTSILLIGWKRIFWDELSEMYLRGVHHNVPHLFLLLPGCRMEWLCIPRYVILTPFWIISSIFLLSFLIRAQSTKCFFVKSLCGPVDNDSITKILTTSWINVWASPWRAGRFFW